MIFDLEQIKEMPTCMQNNKWHLAKPVAWVKMSFWNRIKGAWAVLNNKGVVVRWL